MSESETVQVRVAPEEVERAHGKVATAVRLGHLKREPCEVCGADKVHAHHDDYNKPLDVRWLCPKHHREHHALHSAPVAWGEPRTITIRIGPRTRERIESLADTRGMTVGEFVRYAVNYYLDAVPEKRAA